MLHAVFDQLSEALVLYDCEFRITGANRSAEVLFGMSSGEMMGKHCQEIFGSVVCDTGRRVTVGSEKLDSMALSTIRRNTGDGTERLAEMLTWRIFPEGQLAGGVANIQNISERPASQIQAPIAESAVMIEILAFVKRIR